MYRNYMSTTPRSNGNLVEVFDWGVYAESEGQARSLHARAMQEGYKTRAAATFHRDFPSLVRFQVVIAEYNDPEQGVVFAVGNGGEGEDEGMVFKTGYDAWEAAVALAKELANESSPWECAWDCRISARQHIVTDDIALPPTAEMPLAA